MIPALEAKLWTAIQADACPRDVIDAMVAAGEIAAHKQAHATLEKWIRQGCYECGVALDLGWADHGGKVPKPRCDTGPSATITPKATP